jgi:hypothetical protein
VRDNWYLISEALSTLTTHTHSRIAILHRPGWPLHRFFREEGRERDAEGQRRGERRGGSSGSTTLRGEKTRKV